MLKTPPVGFIRQTVLNMKVVRIYFQIQVYVGSGILADARKLIEKKRGGMSHPTDCSKNCVMKLRNESCCKLDRQRGCRSKRSAFLIGWHCGLDIDMRGDKTG